MLRSGEVEVEEVMVSWVVDGVEEADDSVEVAGGTGNEVSD